VARTLRGWHGAQEEGLASVWQGSLLSSNRDGTGLHYRRNPYYDPVTGRFTQQDPIGIVGGVNVYGFAEGDPVNFSDPFGLQGCAENPNGSECLFIRAVAGSVRVQAIDVAAVATGMLAGVAASLTPVIPITIIILGERVRTIMEVLRPLAGSLLLYAGLMRLPVETKAERNHLTN
jgi:RHS repeat-associated protein